jgi:hypothetical protein
MKNSFQQTLIKYIGLHHLDDYNDDDTDNFDYDDYNDYENDDKDDDDEDDTNDGDLSDDLPENEIVYTNDEGKQLRKWKFVLTQSTVSNINIQFIIIATFRRQ